MAFLRTSKNLGTLGFLMALSLSPLCSPSSGLSFSVDLSPQPEKEHPQVPIEGETVDTNPPSLVWREDTRAASYQVEFSQSEKFSFGVRKAEDIVLPFFNDSQALTPGRWYWRYFVKTKEGKFSDPSPARSFVVPADAPQIPLPGPKELLEKMPAHPRIFVTPETLASFREKRNGAAKEAWQRIEEQANRLLLRKPTLPAKRVPLAEAKIKHSKTSQSHTWKKGEAIRRQVFWVDKEGGVFWLPNYSYRDLLADAERTNVLSVAYLISGDKRYADAAREWVALVSQFRLDRHLPDAERAEHDTVVYAYEQGLKALALSYDRLYDQMPAEERQNTLKHIEYHADAAGRWIRDNRKIHLDYQQSHVQQCMHTLLVTVLATAKDSPIIDGWVQYIVPQYVNRIAWTSKDGGYFEGQTYGHKFGWILEGLAAIRTACGINLFEKPELRHAGTYWLYAMNLNYWYQHWGDNYSLIWPYANPRDSYISGFLATMTGDPYVKWYADTVLTDPESIPFRYLSESSIKAKPPIDIAQAKLFPETGVVTAYNRFYDHQSDRIFFRSSEWGSHSHSHADQNGFVLHSGGEILAPDTGYYTYSGDDYHHLWSKSTFAHNSMLINGAGQPLGITSKGNIESFFHGGKMTYWLGDASQAYASPMKTFNRSMLFLRPSTYIVYDELQATAPSTFSWLLNTFEKPTIDEAQRRIIVSQQQMRLQVDHLLPAKPSYTSNNDRPYPVKGEKRMWSRVTEAFPQPWHNRVTSKAATSEAFLALMQTYRDADGPHDAAQETIENATTIGLKFTTSDKQGGAALFRRQLKATGNNGVIRAIIDTTPITSDAQAIALLGDAAHPAHWMLAKGSTLSAGGRPLWQSEKPVSASVTFQTPAAAALVRIDGAAGKVQLSLPKAPAHLVIAPPNRPQEGQELPFVWNETTSSVLFTAGEGEAAIWVDPVLDLTAPIPAASVKVTDSTGDYELPLQGAWSEAGEWIYSMQAAPREAGTYTFGSEGNPSELLVQDRWEPMTRSASGTLPLKGTLREGTTLFFHVAPKPGQEPRLFAAKLQSSYAGKLDSIVRNGGFEEGIPNFPPRGWTFQQERAVKLGWPEWSQNTPAEGASCLRYKADGEASTLLSQPMRLLSGGTYHLRFEAKGDISGAKLLVRGSEGNALFVSIIPTNDWQHYEAQAELPPGYCILAIEIPAATSPEILSVDAIEFGKIATSGEAAPATPAVGGTAEQ